MDIFKLKLYLSGKHVGILLIDFKKAFDLDDHGILHKLNYILDIPDIIFLMQK